MGKRYENNFQKLVENLNEIIYTLNDKAIITYVSPNIEVISGYKPSEVTGRLFTDFVHPEDIKGRIENFRKILSGESSPSEYRMLKKKGDFFWIRTNAKAIITDNKVTGIEGILTEITDLKISQYELIKAKEKSEKNEEKLKLLNNLTSELITLESLDSIYRFIANSLHKLYPQSLILYISINQQDNTSKFEYVAGLQNSLLKKVIKISGFNPVGNNYELSDFHHEHFTSGDFIEFKGGLVKFTAAKFPSIAAEALERLFGINKIYTIGINRGDKLLGAVHFFTFNDFERNPFPKLLCVLGVNLCALGG